MSIDPVKDLIIQATNEDATCSKAHAVRLGYWNDAYIHHFCPIPSRKSPEISRGYFVRTQAFKAITMNFIKTHNHVCQVVNLGAGSDTLYFQLRDEGLLPKKFVEVDLPNNVNKKISVMKQKNLLSLLVEPRVGTDTSHDGLFVPTDSQDLINPRYRLDSQVYHLFSFDLRVSAHTFVNHLCNPEFGIQLERSLPTLFIAECVLVYMYSSNSLEHIRDSLTQFPHSAFLLYEQVNMCDKFGSIMIDNFHARGCDLPGLDACQSVRDQEKRFLDVGWKKAKAWTVNEVYQAFSKSTRARIEKVEMLDDLEISRQLFDHYCILLAVADDTICPWTKLEEPLALIP